MLATAVEAEIEAFIASHANERNSRRSSTVDPQRALASAGNSNRDWTGEGKDAPGARHGR